MMGPPNPSRPLQLMRCILGLELFGHPKEMEFLLHGVNPFIRLKWFQSLLEDRWFGIHEVLERAVLIYFPAALVIPTAGVVSDIAQGFFHVALHLHHVALASQKLGEEHIRSVRGWWWWWR